MPSQPPTNDTNCWVVTGALRRVGLEISQELARSSPIGIAHFHTSEGTVENFKKEFPQVATLQADLSTPEGAVQFTAAADKYFAQTNSKLSVLINNAANFVQTPFLESDDALWQKTMQLNLLSPMSLSRWAAKHMIDGGVIINILDIAAIEPWKGYAHHCVSKAGLQMLTQCLARELAPRIRVNAIIPGAILFPDDMPSEKQQRILKRVPLGRQGSPIDVAKAVRYLIDSPYLNGTIITVDGGLSLT